MRLESNKLLFLIIHTHGPETRFEVLKGETGRKRLLSPEGLRAFGVNGCKRYRPNTIPSNLYRETYTCRERLEEIAAFYSDYIKRITFNYRNRYKTITKTKLHNKNRRICRDYFLFSFLNVTTYFLLLCSIK